MDDMVIMADIVNGLKGDLELVQIQCPKCVKNNKKQVTTRSKRPHRVVHSLQHVAHECLDGR